MTLLDVLVGRSDDKPKTVGRATRSEELTYLFFVLWTMVGLCLDGWAHRYQPELESFFTPWHGVFYTGFLFGTAWLARMVIVRRPHTSSLRAAIPDGYQLAVVGLIAFAIGGVGDGFWHTIFGVETGIDALLSPTHLLLLVGMLAGATGPVRSAWRDRASPVRMTSVRDFLPVILSTAVTTTGIAFFFLYANGFSNWQLEFDYTPNNDDVLISSGIFSTLASTIILIAPIVLLLRRWKTPFGTFTIVLGIVGVFMAGLDAFDYWWQIAAPVAGGVAADSIIGWRRLDAEPEPGAMVAELRNRARAVGVGVPLVMWSVSTVAINWFWDVNWPPELWVGQIIMAALAGLGLAIISHPPPHPVAASEPEPEPEEPASR